MFYLLLLLFSLLQADEATIPTIGKFTFKPYGFVATDLHYDTRQVFGFRDDFVVVWPQPILLIVSAKISMPMAFGISPRAIQGSALKWVIRGVPLIHM